MTVLTKVGIPKTTSHPIVSQAPAVMIEHPAVLQAALTSGLCLDVMIERLLDRNERRF